MNLDHFKTFIFFPEPLRQFKQYFLNNTSFEVCFDAPFTHTLCFVVRVENKVHIVNIV